MANDGMIQLEHEHANLARQFNALANVASKELPQYMKPHASTGVTLAAGAASGAVEAYFGVRGGTAINAGIAAASLLGAVVYGDKPDVRELGHAVARGLGSGAAALGVYKTVTDYMATGSVASPIAKIAATIAGQPGNVFSGSRAPTDEELNAQARAAQHQ